MEAGGSKLDMHAMNSREDDEQCEWRSTCQTQKTRDGTTYMQKVYGLNRKIKKRTVHVATIEKDRQQTKA